MDTPRSTQLLTIMESYRKLRNLIETVTKEVEGPRKESTDGEGALITPRPLRSSTDFGDTRSRSSEGHSEDSCSGGGSLHVTAPGMGSLSVTGPVGVKVGAKDKFGAVATKNLLEFGAGSRCFPDAEIGGMAQVTLGEFSDHERHRSVIPRPHFRWPFYLQLVEVV